MTDLQLKPQTVERVQLLARAWGTTPSGALERLLSEWLSLTGDDAQGVHEPEEPPAAEVPIHFVYRGQRADALYDSTTQRVRILSGPGASDLWHAKPSPAARAVVSAVDPRVSPHRNGWGEWIITAIGQPLQTIRPM